MPCETRPGNHDREQIVAHVQRVIVVRQCSKSRQGCCIDHHFTGGVIATRYLLSGALVRSILIPVRLRHIPFSDVRAAGKIA